MDFVLRYGVQASNSLNDWDSFFVKNIDAISGMIKDHLMKKIINTLDSTTSKCRNV